MLGQAETELYACGMRINNLHKQRQSSKYREGKTRLRRMNVILITLQGESNKMHRTLRGKLENVPNDEVYSLFSVLLHKIQKGNADLSGIICQ